MLNKQLQLIGARMGITDIDLMNKRLEQHGGYSQQDRMIRDKRRSLDASCKYSYQGAKIKKIDNSFNYVPALINPDKLNQDYDTKEVSVGFEYGFKIGDIFEWKNTNTVWLICLQELTELAYFKGQIKRCTKIIKWKDEDDVEHQTYAVVRGPTETAINTTSKHDILVDLPNYALNIYVPKNLDTLKLFKRYSKFYLSSEYEIERQICWRVETVDYVSSEGIIEISAEEYYGNEFEDDKENGIVGDLIVEPIDPNPVENLIVGNTYIKPKITEVYVYKGLESSNWELIDDRQVVKIKTGINEEQQPYAQVYWDSNYSGTFMLKYGDSEKTIIVQSLF